MPCGQTTIGRGGTTWRRCLCVVRPIRAGRTYGGGMHTQKGRRHSNWPKRSYRWVSHFLQRHVLQQHAEQSDLPTLAACAPHPTSFAECCQGEQRAERLGDGWFALFFLRTTLRCWKTWVKRELNLVAAALTVRANAEVAIRRHSWDRWRFMMDEGKVHHRGEMVKQAVDMARKRLAWSMWINEVVAAEHYKQR